MLSGNTNPLQMQYGKYILGHVHLGRAFLGIAPRSSWDSKERREAHETSISCAFNFTA